MIEKVILRDQVRSYLVEQMQKGNLNIGKTVNLAALARDLKVSVTPIREALTQLEQSQIIQAIPNRGFVVAELNSNEAKNLYELVADLESMALEASNFNEADLYNLKTQHELFLTSTTPLEKVNTDMELHRLFTQDYSNRRAQQILLDLKTRLFFYELELANNSEFYENAHNQHNSIIEAIEENNSPTAALILKMNWLQSLGYIQKTLRVTD